MLTRDQLQIGDRVKYWWGENIQYGNSVMEVAKLESRGAVCDLLQSRGDGTWRNIGHRMLYEYERLIKL